MARNQFHSNSEGLLCGTVSQEDVSPITRMLTCSRLGLTAIFHCYMHKLLSNVILYLEWPPDLVKCETYSKKMYLKEQNVSTKIIMLEFTVINKE